MAAAQGGFEPIKSVERDVPGKHELQATVRLDRANRFQDIGRSDSGLIEPPLRHGPDARKSVDRHAAHNAIPD